MTDDQHHDELHADVGTPDDVWRVFEEFPLALAALDGPDHRFVACNAACRGLVGRAGFIGRPLPQVIPEVIEQQLLGWLDRTYTSGEHQAFSAFRVQLRPEAGEVRDVFLDCGLYPRRGSDGTVVGVLACVQDVTERVRERQAAAAATRKAVERLEHARDVVLALQRQLLPVGLPVLPGARFAASYLLADEDSAAGGDWFDALALPDGRTAVVIGDVVGHGVAASATMGQLRSVLRDRLEETGEIAPAMAAGERLARRLPAARAATVCIAVLDSAGGEVSYCTAGHPPPLLLPASGQPRYLASSGARPLGSGSTFPVAVDTIAVDDVMLLYTDGIVERPGWSLPASTTELALVAADAVGDRVIVGTGLPAIERACTQTLEVLVRESGHADDVTLLAVQRVQPPPALELEMPADLEAPRTARRAVVDWLRGLGARDSDLVSAQHVVSELVVNVTDHAYPAAAGGGVRVTGTLLPSGEATLVVTDQGRWVTPAASRRRGRGLAVVAALSHRFDLRHGIEGTTVTATLQLTHPTRLLTLDDIQLGAPAQPERPTGDLLLVIDADVAGAGGVRVEGPVDQQTATTLLSRLRVRLTGQAGPLRVDLNGVTHLGSAGVAVLHELDELAAGAGVEVIWYAEPESVAHQVLSVVEFPHSTMPRPPRFDAA